MRFPHRQRDACSPCSWVTVRVLNCGDDFPEAMRAAGFGVRPLGGFARQRQLRLSTRRQSADLWGFAATLTGDEPVRLFDRQRPRKGVRLGERKRRGWDKEEARRFAQWREWEYRK